MSRETLYTLIHFQTFQSASCFLVLGQGDLRTWQNKFTAMLAGIVLPYSINRSIEIFIIIIVQTRVFFNFFHKFNVINGIVFFGHIYQNRRRLLQWNWTCSVARDFLRRSRCKNSRVACMGEVLFINIGNTDAIRIASFVSCVASIASR